jgi:hypothetical protein
MIKANITRAGPFPVAPYPPGHRAKRYHRADIEKMLEPYGFGLVYRRFTRTSYGAPNVTMRSYWGVQYTIGHAETGKCATFEYRAPNLEYVLREILPVIEGAFAEGELALAKLASKKPRMEICRPNGKPNEK